MRYDRKTIDELACISRDERDVVYVVAYYNASVDERQVHS